MSVHPHDPLHAKLASVKRDKSTGTYHRHEVEGDWLKESPDLKREFDRIDALSEVNMLREYGFDQGKGEHVRVKGLGPKDKFVPVKGGFEHYKLEMALDADGSVSSVWKRVMHHMDLYVLDDTTGEWVHVPAGSDVNGAVKTEPNYLWPTERIRLTYGAALKSRLYHYTKACAE